MTATAAYRVTRVRVLRSEWSKLWSVRSTGIALGATALLTIGLGAFIGANYSPGEAAGTTGPVQVALLGIQFGQVIIAVLGVMVAAGEYSTGSIRATLTAVPRRLPVLWAKAAVFGAVAFATLLATFFVTFLVSQGFLSGTDQEAALTDPGIARALVGSAAGIALIGVVSLALGAALRGVPAGIGAYIGGVLILPEVLGTLPFGAAEDAVAYFPSRTVEALMATGSAADLLAPGVAFVALCAWVTVALGAAGLLLRRRDV
ncbi:ABC transporter permease [Streptomyces milbemycinicus]|uniref:ABC transporter permease n=1 Tax=Streptomyces milbemycinicus TaxID=476552 RepID=UPI0033E29C37